MGTDLLNDSFTFILRADAVQPAVGHFQYSIVPHSPPLLQGFTTEVPFVTSTITFKAQSTSKDEAPASSQNEEPAIARQKTEPTMWPGQNHWGNLHEEATAGLACPGLALPHSGSGARNPLAPAAVMEGGEGAPLLLRLQEGTGACFHPWWRRQEGTGAPPRSRGGRQGREPSTSP
uniref:Uncharacterized protein n=1 Tax=Catharus ustulatus TaxID=91951 RepID=A0A8C3U8N3_CATUS